MAVKSSDMISSTKKSSHHYQENDDDDDEMLLYGRNEIIKFSPVETGWTDCDTYVY